MYQKRTKRLLAEVSFATDLPVPKQGVRAMALTYSVRETATSINSTFPMRPPGRFVFPVIGSFSPNWAEQVHYQQSPTAGEMFVVRV